MANLAEPPSPTTENPAAPAVQPPVNLNNWIEENSHLFKPPVSNRYLYDGRDFFVMVIKGPNARNDFHLVDSEEYFYQLKGDIKVRIREGDRIVDHLVREGETFFIPPNVPHAPGPAAGHAGSRGGAPPPGGRERTRYFLLRKLWSAGGRHRFRLRRYRPAFQPGHARFLERRRAAHLQEMRHESRATRADEAVLRDPRLRSRAGARGVSEIPVECPS